MMPKGTRKVCSRGHVFYKNSDCPVCPICWSGYYKKEKQAGFPDGLSAPALRALLGAGITSLTKLSKHTEVEIGDLHGMGPKGIRLLKAALEKKGRSFRT